MLLWCKCELLWLDTHTLTHRGWQRNKYFCLTMKYSCLEKVPVLSDANKAVAELEIMRQQTRTTCSNTETNSTHSEGRARWDVRGIESEHSPPGPNVETPTVSLQQHGAVVDCGGLETSAALETWGGGEKDGYLMKVTFCNLSGSTANVYRTSSYF